MTTPNPTGGIGQAAGELLKEMQKAQADMQQVDQKRQPAAHNQAFQQALNQNAQQLHSQAQAHASSQAAIASQNGRVVTHGAIHKVVKDASVRDKLATTKIGQTEKLAESKLSKMLQGLITGQDKMTKIMNLALSGKQFSPGDLLAMQAGVYRFSQELDLTSKVVEKATGGIKQTLNTQV